MTGKMGGLLPLYLRREPSVDPHAPTYKGRRAFDVVAYSHEDATGFRARWAWHVKGRPRPGRKQATTRILNCFRWSVIWLPDVVERANAQ